MLSLVDWEPRQPGAHVETWNLKDRSGRVDFSRQENLMCVITAVPQNWQDFDLSKATIKSFHKEPAVMVTFPESPGTDSEGNPIIAGKAPVRIEVDPADQVWLENQKYEIAFYIDTIYAIEDEEGTIPFTYRLDTAYIQPGLHIITANVVGFYGEVGTENVLVRVEK